MKLNEARRALTARLAAVTDEAALEADLIMEYATGRKKAVILFSDAELLPREAEAIDAAARRREAHEPLQYILGRWGFMGLEFYTRPGALIPRQDTETLAEHAVCIIRERGYKTALDICTGTGCIAVSLAVLTDADVEASDISPLCAELARQNAEANSVSLRVRTADLFSGAGSYDIITTNPPYLSGADMASLQAEVGFEPALALLGGPDGLDYYRRIAAEAGQHINPGGALVLEVGAGQAEAVRGMFPGLKASLIPDLNGIDRAVEIDF